MEKKNGGLGICSLFSFNHVLLQKWRWRFLVEEKTLWGKVNKATHSLVGWGSLMINQRWVVFGRQLLGLLRCFSFHDSEYCGNG